jgi:hypothetical protein
MELALFVQGTQNLTGASNYWQMVIELRPYMFQVGLSFFSGLVLISSFNFSVCRSNLSSSDPVRIIQTSCPSKPLRKWMSEVFEQKLERRTTVLSPAKGYSNETYTRSGEARPS